MSKSKHLKENVGADVSVRLKHKHKKENKFKRIFLTILQLIFLGLMIFSGTKIYQWWKENKASNTIMEEITANVVSQEDDSKIDFEKLKQINDESVAYLKVNGTNIEYPVVKHSDNSYYLNHSFDKTENGAGWIFSDYRNSFDGTDKNLIIYGHNRRDGSMFGSLKNILTEEWQNKEENMTVSLTTEKEEQEYQVFSVYKIEKEEYYITTDFTDKEYEKFINTIKKRSMKDFGVEINKQDSILTLSTCDNNNQYRVVLHAKKIK